MAIQISGTTVIDNSRNIVNVATGSSTAPSITPTSDTNTGIYFPSADNLSFSTGGVLRLNLNSSGDVTTDGQFKELYAGSYWNVVTQADVGYGASQVPLNQYLGQLAFLDDFSPNALREQGSGADDVIVGAGGTLGVLSDLYVNGNTYIPTVASNITMSNGNIIFPAVAGRGVYFGGETSGTDFAYIREYSDGQLEFGSDDVVRFLETDNSTVRVSWSLNTGSFDFIGKILSDNLGVGVRNPASNTQVAIAGTLGISEVGGSGTRTLFTSSGNGFYLNHTDNSNIHFQSQSSTKLQYRLSDNNWSTPSGVGLLVGTGAITGTANQKLQVNGGAYVSDNLGIGTTNPNSVLDVRGTVSIGTTIDIVPYDNLGTLSFEGSAGQLFSITNNLTSGSIFSVNDVSGIPSIDVDADGTVLIAPYGSTEYVGIGLTNPTEKLDVSGNLKVSGNSYTLGNFGVGTLNPSVKLDVYGNNAEIFSRNPLVTGNSTVGAVDGDFFSTPSYAGVLIRKFGSSASGNIFSSIPNANLGILAFQNTANGLIYTNGGSPLIFGTTSLERMRISSSGDVGIGIANPTARLHISGGVNVVGVVTATSYVGSSATINGNITVTGQAQLNRVAITTTATNITMQAGRTYPFYASITLTLPASPTVGDKVEIINRSNTVTAVVARNGSNIMGLAENMTVDIPDVGFTLIYANAADGWIIGK